MTTFYIDRNGQIHYGLMARVVAEREDRRVRLDDSALERRVAEFMLNQNCSCTAD